LRRKPNQRRDRPMAEVYRLRPHSSFHFGVRGVGVEATGVVGPSDTLFSALCLMMRELRGNAALEEFLAPFRDGDPPFLLSSAFPYAGNVLLFPRPWLRPDLGSLLEDDVRHAKTLKKVRFVSQGILRALLHREPLGDAFVEENLLQRDRVWVSADERSDMPNPRGEPGVLWRIDTAPRVTIDRATGASAVYQAGYVHFQPGCGLYLLIAWCDEALRDLVEQALEALGDAGVGGERSAGHGLFELLPPEAMTLSEPEGASRFVTLSLYHPTEAEVASVLGPTSAYELEPRGGWMASPDEMARRRKVARMLSEGSVLTGWEPDRVYGALADVTPEPTGGWTPPHPVYRYGFAFPIASVGAEEEEG
jgi:CRISPR-associated protein Csm4